MHPKHVKSEAGGLRRLVREYADYRRRLHDRERLRDMPDYLLEDIGLTRDHVRSAPGWYYF